MSRRPAPNLHCASRAWPRGPFDRGHAADRGAAAWMGHLAYLVAKRRDQAELKQRDLARELGVDEGTITRPETGSSWTDTYVILRVCERLAIPLTLPALRDLEPLEPADGSEA